MISLTSRGQIPTWKPLAVVAALSACFMTPAMAQTNDDNPLSQVVVTASRIAQLQTDALPHTTVITSEDIRNSQAADLPSLLRAEAGLEFSQNGGPGSTTALFMRGAAPNQTLILIDGVPVRRQDYSGSAALEHILADQIDRIEIVRGNVSAIYGSGAIGGVIQIFTKRGAGEPAFNVSAEAGSRGTFNLNGAVSGQVGDTRYALSLTRFKTDGISSNNTQQYPNENPDKDGAKNTSLAASVTQEWTKGHEFGARIYANDGKVSYDGGGSGAPADINEAHSKQQSLALFSKDRLTPDWLSTVTVSRTETRNQNIYVPASGQSDSRFNSDSTLLQWNNELTLSQQWTLAAGIDAAKENADVFSFSSIDYGYGAAGSSTNQYSRSTSSVYTGLNGKIEAHQLQLNLRHDQVGGAGSDTTGYLGYGFAVTPAFKLLASASTAFHAPTLIQVFDPMYGNRDLKAERARTYELGAQYAAGATLLRVTAFDSSTRDQFGYDSETYKTINIDKATNQGLELSATSRMLDTDVRASMTLQNPKDDSTGQHLIRRARTLAALALAKKYGALRIGTDVQYTGSRGDKDFSAYPATDKDLASYVLLNLNLRYQLNKNVSLFGRIDNVLNRDYQSAYGYNQPPRGVFAGLSWQQ
ncbi:MAG: vitamin B12 transporter [Janthinobacterium sp.]|jgi:vitamin B12 transporter